jgi:Flp pilus assembly protein TadG
MSPSLNRGARRRGAIAPLTALMLTLLVGMMAFTIDVGWIVTVKAELQNAADAGSLAGAARLQNLYVQFNSPLQTNQISIFNTATTDTTSSTSPIPTAQQFASANQAGGVSVTVPTGDVTFSYYDGSTFATATIATFPNTVNVTTRRDSTANTSLGLFFAKVFNISSIDLTASASATIYAGDVTSLQVIPGVSAHILPVALDVNVWKQFMATGESPPTLISSYVGGPILSGPNGLPQLQVYPVPTFTPGSFGLIDTGVPSNNSPAFRSWIDDGSTPNDINYLLNNNLLPVSPNSPEPWKVGPGLKSTLLTDFQSQIGKANLIPLFAPVSTPPNYQAANGTGQGATYSVVGFVGVTISSATGSGTSMNISIQPMANVDPTAILSNIGPARATQTLNIGTGSMATTFVSAKLTQ